MNAVSMRRGWCPGARRPMETGDGLLVRVHPPAGVLSAGQARALADLAQTCGNGLLDVTARGNLQIRGVSEATHPAVLEGLSAIGLLEGESDGPYRLTLVSPLSGLDPEEAFDAAALAGEIEARVGVTASSLPAKFYVSVDGGGTLRPGPGADVRVAPAEGGVAIGLAHGDGYVWSGPVDLRDAAAAVASVVAWFATDRGTARRMRDVPAAFLEELLQTITRERASPLPRGEGSGVWGAEDDLAVDAALLHGHERASSSSPRSTPHTPSPSPRGRGERVAPVTGESAHPPSAWETNANSTTREPPFSFPSGKERVAGYIADGALLLALPFGRATATQLRAAAEWSERHGAGEIRLSFTRGILIPHVAPAATDALVHAAEAAGFVTDPSDPRLALVACPGAPACGRGTTPAPDDALALADAARPLAASGARIHVSACPKGCAHPRAADLTLAGRADGRYDVIPGGAAGDRALAALPLAAIVAILRRTTDPRGLAAAFGEHER